MRNKKTWDDVVRRAMFCPYMRMTVDAVRRGFMSQEEALTEIALELSNVREKMHDQMVDYLSADPRPHSFVIPAERAR